MIKKYLICRICKKTKLKKTIDFGKTPIGDFWLDKNETKLKIKNYPLNLGFCNFCKLSQLIEGVNEKLIYKKFFYEISVTSGLKEHYFKFENLFTNKFNQNMKLKNIIDIGSNDGSFLEPFKERGYNVFGVEPVKKFNKICKNKGIKILNGYFNKSLAYRIKKNTKYDIVSVNFLVANIDYLDNFLDGIELISKEKSYLIIETSHLLEVINKKLYDTFFHEHIFYFSLYNLNKIFSKRKYSIHHVEMTKSKGGSLRLILKKNEKCYSSVVNKLINNVIRQEKKYLFNSKIYSDFGKYLDNKKIEIKNILKNYDEKIVIFGASVATTTLVKKFNLEKKIKYFIDDNKIMHNKFSPLNKKPVFKSSHFFKDKKSNTLLIIAIRYTDMILKKYQKYLKYKNVIRIYPKVKLVNFKSRLKRVKNNQLV